MSVARMDDPALDVDAAVDAALEAVERRDSAVTLPPRVRNEIVERVEQTFGVRIGEDRSDAYIAAYWRSAREHIR